jgi:hypothetical protein
VSTDLVVANMALSHLGVGQLITSLTDDAAEAKVMQLFLNPSRDEVLRSRRWGFATKLVELDLVEEDPTSEWGFSYRYPSDCLELHRILNPLSRVDNLQDMVKWRLGADDAGTLILTDQEEAEAEYTFRHKKTVHYPPDFLIAWSFKLATYAAPRISGADMAKFGARALELGEILLDRAAANSANEEAPDERPDAECIRDRE